MARIVVSKDTMKAVLLMVAVIGTLVTCHAQLFTFTRDDVIRYTAKNPFGRFEDGRPKVPDDLLEKCGNSARKKSGPC